MAITVNDLKPGDIIVSHKGAPWWNLIQKFFNWRIKRNALKVYGKDCIFPEADHNRIVMGEIGGKVWCFHWTAPTSRFEEAKPWIVEPSYAMIMRDRKLAQTTDKWLAELLQYDGSIYDIGQLIDIDLGLKNFFDFGKSNYVCSVGIRIAYEHLMGIEKMFPESDVQKTLPCVWVNHPEMFECINCIDGVDKPLLNEPKG